jgi:TolB-like protein/Tfp pilus assembly protein PilF
LERFIAQLKQRQVFKVATIYAVSAWPMIQIADLAVPALGLPDSVMTLLLQIFIAGFPVCLMLAWLFNITSKGIVRTTSENEADEEPQANVQTTLTVAGSMLLIVLVTLGSQLAMDDEVAQIAGVATPIETLAALSTDSKKESIAVLPFVPFSNDKEDEYFADGMVEELLNLLARIPELQVSARTSSFAYKGVTNKTIPQIGRELGVNTILEGSIRKNDVTNKIRVTAQLIKVSTGEHLWSETYDREYRDIFQIQDDIASAVVKKMELTLLGNGQKREFVAQTNSVDAMVAFGKGQTQLSHRTAASLRKALAHFNEAIKLDPNYARAYVGVADAFNLLPLYGNMSRLESQNGAREAIDNALAIDSQLGEAYAALGLMLTYGDREKADESFKQAIALNPSYAMAYMWYATLLSFSGDMIGNRKMYEKAFELDPKSPVAAINVAMQYYGAGNEDKAMEMFSYIIANDPYYPGAYNLVGKILAGRGRLDQSIDMYKRALTVDVVNKDAVGGLLDATMNMGYLEETDRWFEYIERHGEFINPAMFNLYKAQYHTIKGDKAQAVSYLGKVDFGEDKKGKSGFLEGEIAYFMDDFAKVVTAYERLLSQENKKVFYYAGEGDAPVHLAYAYQQLGAPQKAKKVLDEFEAHLKKDQKKMNQSADYYYKMALIKSLQGKKDDAFYFMQGAINVGWVKVWRAEIEPAFASLNKESQFTQMMGGVKARLATMRTQLEADDAFLMADSDML